MGMTTAQTQAQTPDAKWGEAVQNIIQLTREGHIKWSPLDFSAVMAPGQTVLSAYQASFEGKTIRLQNTVVGRVAPGRELETPIHSTFSLRIVDENGSSLFVFPLTDDVVDLFIQVKIQLAGVEDFLASLQDYVTIGPVKSASEN